MGFLSNFERAFLKIIDIEGGYVDDPTDPGGPTKYGISQQQYPNLNIEKLSYLDAKEIYYKDFWQQFGLGIIPSDEIATKCFDLLVNMPPKNAVKCFQRALMACGHRLKWDGILGPITLKTLQAADPVALLPAMRSEQAGYYERLILKKPEFEKFRGGWLKRAYS